MRRTNDDRNDHRVHPNNGGVELQAKNGVSPDNPTETAASSKSLRMIGSDQGFAKNVRFVLGSE